MAVSTKSSKDQFLEVYEQEHKITMRVLNAFPPDKADFRPDPNCKTARELAWVFVMERGLGTKLYHDEYAKQMPSGNPPPPPEAWSDLLGAVEKAHKEFGDLIRSASEEKLKETIRFFVAPKTMGDIPRIQMVWFLLHDQIHHRGQFSVYLRAAGGKVPSIYGPSGDEPWM
jgi:uncharacterized damage-inducible protein DinB